MSGEPVIEIREVLNQAPLDHLHGGHLDAPIAGGEHDSYELPLTGWALGRWSPVDHVEVVLREGRSVLCLRPNRERPDIGDAFRGVPGGDRAGFETTIGVLELPREFDIPLHAVLETGKRVAIGRIRGSRRSLRASTEARIQPAMITTLGRSGSKWLVWLLSCHPQVVALNPLSFEPRVATYWMSVFRALSRSRSFLRQIHNESWEPNWWLGSEELELPAPLEADLGTWLGRDAVESVASMCQMRIDQLYSQVGASVDKPSPDYFVEKSLLDPAVVDLISEIYPGAKELILVRDVRDQLCSILAWNQRRGHHAFGRELVTSDAEFVASRLRTDVMTLLSRWRTRGDQAHLVRYEDLVSKPRETLTGILRYLGLDDDERTVVAVLDRARAADRGFDGHSTALDPESSIGRWQRDLDPDLIDVCERELGDLLEAFGYRVGNSVRADGS
jgi:hypothetical protein